MSDKMGCNDSPRRIQRVAAAAACLTAVVCVLVVLGWIFDVVPLKSIAPDLATMKMNTALAFAAGSAALWSSVLRAPQSIRLTCAIATLLLGGYTLGEYRFNWLPDIDQLLVHDALHSPAGHYPGRMATATALGFVALGSALLCIDLQWPRGVWPTQWLALVVALNGFLATLGYLYGVQSLYEVLPYGSMALHTALLFMVLGFGLLSARPTQGLMARVIADDAGGLLLRRLLPAAIVVPVAVGALRLQGQNAGLYTSEFGVAVYTAVNVVIFAVLLWWTAGSIRRIDQDRRAAQVKLRIQFSRLDLLQQITHAIGERLDLRSIFLVTLRRVEADLPVDFACVCLADSQARCLTVNTIGPASAALSAAALPADSVLDCVQNGLARCLNGELVHEQDISTSSFEFPRLLARAGLSSLVLAPLRGGGSTFGLLVAARMRANSFSSNDCEFLRQLAEHVGVAAHQAGLHETLQRAYDDLRQSQQVILQQERLRALGQMASGIAHDINNAISPISLYTESLLEREPNLSKRTRDSLTTIQRAISDVAQTVARMREFYRPRDTQTQLAPLDLNALIEQVIDLTRARWNDMAQRRGVDIELRHHAAANLPAVLGADNEIRDAFTNLIFNAVDAMPQGGLLTIRTALVDPARLVGTTNGQRVQVEVCDSGCGMDEATRRRCLEPFFTTKGDRGTGMGLAMVFGMAQRHGAELEIDSEPGCGTVIRLVFPAASNASAANPDRMAEEIPRGLRVLIIDDDPLILAALSAALEADDHLVISAEGGQAGIEAFRAGLHDSETFAAVITDLGMPAVDGSKVAAAIKARSPKTPIIMLTGWGQPLLTAENLPANVDCVLGKPPRVQQLRAALAAYATRAPAATVK